MRQDFDPEGANSDITLWWLAGNATPTPSGQWLHIIANYIVDNQIDSATSWKLLGNAGVAGFDVSIAIWREKYRHNLLRPESLWFDQLGEGAPMLRRETPNHPSYPSGHSGFSAAAAAVLTGTLEVETVAVRDSLPPDVIVPAQRRDWDDVWAAVDEAGLSRVLSGFHYPIDVEAGNELGRCVAAAVIDGLQVVPAPVGDGR
jgi:membrane-associated phospholipid phosphatase